MENYGGCNAMWRWDQGRLLYFQFDVLKSIASVLVRFDGVNIRASDALFRSALEAETDMPFAPDHYTVMRNYKRMFECAFLATVYNEHLVVTDFAKELAHADSNFSSVDDYLLNYISRFRFPFPAFDGYDAIQERVYPFCAIIKLLIAIHLMGWEAKISIEDVFHYIIGNQCTGYEDINRYTNLPQTQHSYTEAEKRQVREMVIFISQLSCLKYYNGYLWLDVTNPAAIEELVHNFLIPDAGPVFDSRTEEFMRRASLTNQIVLPTVELFTTDVMDIEFIEGKRRRVEHFRVDRSPLLRKYFREHNPVPVCDMCKMDVSFKYPWAGYMLDIHHLLPLSSSIAITAKGTSLSDIVGLCPSCHRSTHVYYTQYLRNYGLDDFRSREEARDVYWSAVREVA